jgi:hypothetical protein
VNIAPETARRWVLVSMVLLLIMGTYKGSKPGDVGMAKRLWGVGMLGTMLCIAADFVPQLAGPFAVLVVLGYATTGGDKAIENVLGKVSGGAASTEPTPGTVDIPLRNLPPGSTITTPEPGGSRFTTPPQGG